MEEKKKSYVKNKAPEKLMMVIAIVNESKVRYYTNLIQSFEGNLYLSMPASGTSEMAILDYVSLSRSYRSAIFSIVREEKVKDLLEALEENFNTLKGGGGVAVTVPLSSIIGALTYGFLSNDKRTMKK